MAYLRQLTRGPHMPLLPEPLCEFFDSLRTEADLRQLIADGAQENLHLELKQKKDGSTGELDDGDKRQFSRALSGFANSDGGILLWGIRTDGSERAAELRPIRNVHDFQSRLKKLLLNATQPVTDGVRIEVVLQDGNDDVGYVKCLVPPSDKTPHRAMLYDREYFKRSVEGFYRLEHFDLEDMFGRRPTPLLKLQTHIRNGGSVGGGGSTEHIGLLILSIANEGRGSARAPYLSLRPEDPYSVRASGLDGNAHEGLPRVWTAEHRRIVFTSADIVIHPSVALDVAAVELRCGVDYQGRISTPRELKLAYDLSAENAALARGKIVMSPDEIAAAVLPAAVYRAVSERS